MKFLGQCFQELEPEEDRQTLQNVLPCCIRGWQKYHVMRDSHRTPGKLSNVENTTDCAVDFVVNINGTSTLAETSIRGSCWCGRLRRTGWPTGWSAT